MAGSFGPKIDSFDPLDPVLESKALGNHIAMAEPGGFLMDMVRALARLGRLHGPGPRQGNLAWSINRPQIRLGDLFAIVIARNRVLPDQKIDRILTLYHFHLAGILRGRSLPRYGKH